MIFRTLAAAARTIFSPTVRAGSTTSAPHPLPEHVRAAIEKLPEPIRAATTNLVMAAFAAGVAEASEPTRAAKFFVRLILAWASARRAACATYQRKLGELADAARAAGAAIERQRITEVMDAPEAHLAPRLAWELAKAGRSREEAEAALLAASPPPGVDSRAESITLH